jgi:hypothetical protein
MPKWRQCDNSGHSETRIGPASAVIRNWNSAFHPNCKFHKYSLDPRWAPVHSSDGGARLRWRSTL